MTRRRITIWFPSVFVLSVLSIAAGPPPEGTTLEVNGGVGTYEYQTGGCGTTRYTNRSNYVSGHAGLTHRTTTGPTVSADMNATFDKNVPSSSTDPAELNREHVVSTVSARVGWHFKYGGFEAGPAVYVDFDKEDDVHLFPSVALWAGTEVLHGYGEVLAKQTTLTEGGIGRLGVGHHGEYYEVRAGVVPSFYSGWQLELGGSGKVLDDFWIGATAHVGEDGMFGSLKLTTTF